jgi:hypothetical protein
MATNGWIKIDRAITKHWLWKDPIKLKWWLDIIISVNFKDYKELVGGQVIECKRGESLLSLQSWADRWVVDKSKVRRFFILLQKEKIIDIDSVQKTTRITVLNYDSYQSIENDDETIMKQKRNDDETMVTPIEERKEFKEGIKKERRGRATPFSPPLLSDVIDYFKQNEYSQDSANTAFNYYNDRDWKDSKNNKVSNWKLKMQNVWFKEENKAKQKRKYVGVRLNFTYIEMLEDVYEKSLKEKTLNCDNPIIEKRFEK